MMPGPMGPMGPMPGQMAPMMAVPTPMGMMPPPGLCFSTTTTSFVLREVWLCSMLYPWGPGPCREDTGF